MKKININFLFPLVALVLLVTALSQQIFNAPPVGKLLDPFSGAVQNENEDVLQNSQRDISGVSKPVSVFFDDRDVPHIYAQTEEDLYFTQGYVTASYRLWQMDFLSYVSAGRLSEIFADGFLDYDRKQRRMGLLDAAKASLKMIEKDPRTIKILSAYTKGVNAYISRLNYKKMPLEYKLLDYKPEPWSNLKSVLIMKYMADMLSGYDEDYNATALMMTLGEEKYNKLFPIFGPHSTPIAGDASKTKNEALAHIKKPDYLDFSFFSERALVSKSNYNREVGSNSWVVSGKKTASGFPILASDPHLNLTLPAIWFEMQLSGPGSNVYGVTIPGTPAVIIGFNENIAWGITNGLDDVKDWYKLRLTDDYKKYELDGEWKETTVTVEAIKRKGQSVFYDTIYHTIHGPVVSDKRFVGSQPEMLNHAMRWELHNPSNEFSTFIQLNEAKTYNDYREALKHYSSPVQNFTFASKNNDIAVHHQGKMAVKWAGQGKFILDGTNGTHIPGRYIPSDSLPQVYNPECNYVVSANQRPTDASYPYYYTGYYSENRARRIKSLLEQRNGYNAGQMQAMQLDNTSAFAADVLSVIIPKIDRTKLTEGQLQLLQNLQSWRGVYDADDTNAELFQLWWKNVKEYTWDEFTKGAKLPEDDVLAGLVQAEPDNEFFDRQGTSVKENAAVIITQAFTDAEKKYNEVKKEKGAQWGNHNTINIMHLTNIGPFSRPNLSSAGNAQAINAVSPGVAPSWRMIVELGDRPNAYGVYPGGQSGNVASASFDAFVNDWNKGKYYPLTFFMSIDEAKEQTRRSWSLK